jgi:hypothetical protein
MREALLAVYEWVVGACAPNERRRYSRCPICDATWWDDNEQHNPRCWVPQLKSAAQSAPAQATADTGAMVPCPHWGGEDASCVWADGECNVEPCQPMARHQ